MRTTTKAAIFNLSFILMAASTSAIAANHNRGNPMSQNQGQARSAGMQSPAGVPSPASGMQAPAGMPTPPAAGMQSPAGVPSPAAGQNPANMQYPKGSYGGYSRQGKM